MNRKRDWNHLKVYQNNPKLFGMAYVNIIPNFSMRKHLQKSLKRIGIEKTQKQISDAIYKLKQQLKNEQWMIKPGYSKGEYALVRRQPE